MQYDTDYKHFADQFAASWEMFGRQLSAKAIDRAFNLMKRYELSDVLCALAAYDSQRHKEPPKPGDLLEMLNEVDPSGHPSPAEAWGIVEKLARDEAAAGFVTEEMQGAMAAVDAQIKGRDWIGARRDFQDVYKTKRDFSISHGIAAVWTMSQATGPDRERTNAEAIEAARAAKRIAPEYAALLLPGPNVGLSEAIALLSHQPGGLTTKAAEEIQRLKAKLKLSADDSAKRQNEERAESMRLANEYCQSQQVIPRLPETAEIFEMAQKKSEKKRAAA